MSGEQGLSAIPGIVIDNGGMLPFVDLALMAEAGERERKERQQDRLYEVVGAEQRREP
jgi:hypothetical protein